MPRSMTAGMSSEIGGTLLRPAFFVQIQFGSETVYLWTGTQNIAWNGQTWLGVGALGSISTVEEGSNVEAKGVTLTLSGFDATLLTDVLVDFRLGLPVVVYLGLFDATGALIPDPITSWAGRTDQPTVEVTGETASISINCESRLLSMNVAADRRYTNDDQQIESPGDEGFKFVAGIAEMQIYWGRTPTKSNV